MFVYFRSTKVMVTIVLSTHHVTLPANIFSCKRTLALFLG